MDQLVVRLATDDALFYEYMRWGDDGSDVALFSLLLLCQIMDIETSLYSYVYPTSCMVCWICTVCVSSGTTRIIKPSLPWTVMWIAARGKCVALSPVTPPPTSRVAASRRSLTQRSPKETHNGTRRKKIQQRNEIFKQRFYLKISTFPLTCRIYQLILLLVWSELGLTKVNEMDLTIFFQCTVNYLMFRNICSAKYNITLKIWVLNGKLWYTSFKRPACIFDCIHMGSGNRILID